MLAYKNRHAAALAVLLASMAFQAHGTPVTQFASGSDGWVGGGGTAAASWKSTGGIDDSGYLQLIDMAGGQMLAISPAFGNQLGSLGGVLSFSYNVLALGAGNHYVPNNGFGIVTIYSGDSFVTADLISDVSVASNLVGTGWHQAALGLSAGLWSGNASLATVLANVTRISIDAEYDTTQRWPDEVVGIDNFALAAAPPSASQVPETFVVGTSVVGGRHRRVSSAAPAPLKACSACNAVIARLPVSDPLVIARPSIESVRSDLLRVLSK